MSSGKNLAMRVSWLFPTREYTMLPAKDIDQLLNINHVMTDCPIQETSDNTSRCHGLKLFRAEYPSCET